MEFTPEKIQVAITKAYIATKGKELVESDVYSSIIELLTKEVVTTLFNENIGKDVFHIESIQDIVELSLMRSGDYDVAKAYVIYREERNKSRLTEALPAHAHIEYWIDNGVKVPFDINSLDKYLRNACVGIKEKVDYTLILGNMVRDMYTGCSIEEVKKSAILAARTLIEKDPIYNKVTARLLLHDIRLEVLGITDINTIQDSYESYFSKYIKRGIDLELLDPELATFDLDRVSEALVADRDLQFEYLGLQTLYDRYLIKYQDVRMELPQILFMRVAMGLALNETNREEKAIEFYNLLSSFDFMSSTPTLFNSGTTHSQLSSCYLTTIDDSLEGIYDGLKENAMLSKYAGGLGNDWTQVRALGSYIKGTNGKSQGTIPFLKVANDTLVAVNQCFSPNTLIYTNKGIKEIKDIKVKDLVLGISGTYREVVEVYSYRQEEPMVEICTKASIRPIQVTDGHPFYAVTNVPSNQTLERTYRQIVNGSLKADWVPSGQLKEGDYIGQVIPTEIINVKDVTEDDMRLYGLLLGHGNIVSGNNKDIEWTLSENIMTKDYLRFVKSYLKDRNIQCWETETDDKHVTLHWSFTHGNERSADTGNIINNLGNTLPFTREDIYAEDGSKHIATRFTHLPLDLTKSLIFGLLESKGFKTSKNQLYFSNTSTELTYNLAYQLLRLGVPVYGSLSEAKKNRNSYVITIPVVDWIAELYDMKPINRRNWFVLNDMVYTKVKYVEVVDNTEEVYDLKVEGDESYMTVSGLVHNGGLRKGAGCAYLEVWHLDIEEFVELRKNTGDDRRRTHDMNIATWIPDLFMKRVMEDKPWTLFSPSEVRELHDLYGQAFEDKYLEYEELAQQGNIRSYRTIDAVQLWRKILGMLFETGHPWITFKDPCNIRSPQQHAGVVHSSNLCCIAKDQRVVTDVGMVTIDNLYKSQYKPKVPGRAIPSAQASEMLLPRPNAPMVRVETKEGYTHKVTPDHRIWVSGIGEVEAQNLKPGDLIELQRFSMFGTENNILLVDTLNELRNKRVDVNRVPDFVFTSNRETVERYLRNIYVNESVSFVENNICNISIKNELSYLQDVQLLWLNLGIKSYITEQDTSATLTITGNTDCYIVEEITSVAKIRQDYDYLDNLVEPTTTDRNLTAVFTGLTELPNEDAYCLTVDSDDHSWTVNGFITHNTEITLNTNEEEIAVCNLGSVNLSNHIVNGKLDTDKIKKTVTTAIRMLDNVIDINFYPVEKARNSNIKHRPIGLGIMGFQDALHKLNISYASNEAVEFADTSMETIAYHAYFASSVLAEERGVYSSYSGSLWSQGILPLDSIELLRKERNGYLEVDTNYTLDWDKLREQINQHGMRNSNCLAIAPTATIANITGVSASIEPTFQNLYVKSNLSGEFTVINKYLVNELKGLNIWDDNMVNDIKVHDGILANIDRIPDNIKHLYVTAFELDTKWIVEAAARRQKWIDQAQSLNVYMAGVSGKKMDEAYKLAWVRGLKTTYYLRALSASNAEKSTIYTGVHNKVSNVIEPIIDTSIPMCKIDDPDCESCQ